MACHNESGFTNFADNIIPELKAIYGVRKEAYLDSLDQTSWARFETVPVGAVPISGFEPLLTCHINDTKKFDHVQSMACAMQPDDVHELHLLKGLQDFRVGLAGAVKQITNLWDHVPLPILARDGDFTSEKLSEWDAWANMFNDAIMCVCCTL